MAGLKNKDEDFWEFVRKYHFIGLVETWLEEKEWDRWKNKLPEKWSWRCQGAERANRKGRAKGGIVTGIRKDMEINKIDQEEIEGIQRRWIKINEEEWEIVTVYNRDGKTEKLRELGECTDEWKENIIILGDFNARIGEEGEQEWGQDLERKGEKRGAMDKIKNKEGERLMEFTEEKGWIILNGNKEGDETGEWTYNKGEGKSTIDYGITNIKTWEKIKEFKVKTRVESDHEPLVVKIVGGNTEEEERTDSTQKVQKWGKEEAAGYKERTEQVGWKEEEEVEREWRKIKETIQENITWKKRVRGRELGWQPWRDNECRIEKKELQKKWKKVRRGEYQKGEYRKREREYKNKCEEKKQQWRRKEEENIQKIKTEKEAWDFVNKQRRKKEGISRNIGEEEWKKYFMETLGGGQCVEPGRRETEEARRGIEEPLTDQEMEKMFGRLKKEKAAGSDQIKNEAWIHGGAGIKRKLRGILEMVWRGKGFIDEWREGVIVPIHKKGNREEVTNYRGVTILNTGYRMYATLLNNRIMKRLEENGGLEETQTGFRKGRGTMDNIFMLKHLVGKRLTKKRGKVHALFLDLKAAFDRIDRKILWKAMEERGIEKEIIERVKEIYEETRCRVRIGEKLSTEFWVKRGVRQGCPLSPTLFNIYIADLEKKMREGQDGGLVVGNKKIWTLTYADDVVMMAETEEEMKGMMRRAKRYFEGKGLEVNEKKTKIIVFSKGGGKRKKRDWKWGEKEIEEVKSYDYLGYRITRNNTDNEHVKQRVKKANMAMGAIWGIGERNFKGDIKWRVKLFDAVIKSILMYGVEIWGWKEWDMVEKVQERYLRWIIGVDRVTPGYVVREETKRRKLRIETADRARRYEEKSKKNENKRLMRECWKEVDKGKTMETRTSWGNERERYYNRCGMSSEGIEKGRQEGKEVGKWLMERDTEVMEQETTNKIEKATYGWRYKFIRTVGTPRYMKEAKTNAKGGQKIKTIARARCGNEEYGNRYWMKEEERMCRLCEEERETLEHVANKCRCVNRWDKGIDELVGDEGKGYKWLEEWQRKIKEKLEKRKKKDK